MTMLTKEEKIQTLKNLLSIYETFFSLDEVFKITPTYQQAQQWLSELEAVSLNCPVCAETFKSDIDLEAHLFNNKHCTIQPPVK